MKLKITIDNKFAIYSIIIGISYLLNFSYLTLYVKQSIYFLFGIDYSAYYAASQMVINGEIDYIYDIDKHHAMVENILSQVVPFELPWFYPPNFLLIVLPLAILPYKVALFFWIFSTLTLCVYSIYILVEKNWKIAFVILGFPAILMNLRWGQNGFLSTALLALSFYFIQFNPKKAGVLLGLLTYKPQILCFPLIILILCKKWTTLLWTGVTFGVISLISALLLGVDVWAKFILNTGGKSAEILNQIFGKILGMQPTVYALFKILGVQGICLFLIVIVVASTAVITCMWICRKSNNFKLKSSAITIGIFLSMPYLGQYDLIILGIPVVMLFWDFRINGSKCIEKISLFLLWIMPLINMIILQMTRIQICPIVLIIVMTLICYRVYKQNIA